MKKHSQIIKENQAWAKEILEKLDKKMSVVAIRSREKLPYGCDEKGFHIDMSAEHSNFWTNGFFGGTCAMLYDQTKNEEYLKTLHSSEKLLDKAFDEKYENLHHDVGFMWYLVSGANYRLTGCPQSRKRLFYAASTLMGRFIPGGNYIKAWNTDVSYNYSIIDSLMNLPLLYWASEEFKDDRYRRVAIAHADNAIRTHMRDDGSIAHIVEHDRDTGDLVTTNAGQGYAVGSSWSRGQSWALYGFVISYIHTGEQRFLDAAKRIANYFIAAVADDWLPRLDFRSPDEPVYYDSTAGAIASCGLLELGRILPELEGGMYTNAAMNILKAMTEKFCNFNPATDDFLGFGSEAYPNNPNFTPKTNVPIIYGDFFYTEAILKILGSEFFMW